MKLEMESFSLHIPLRGAAATAAHMKEMAVPDILKLPTGHRTMFSRHLIIGQQREARDSY